MAEKTEKIPKTEKAQEKTPTREELEKSFKEYSVAEFFKKNRQMLGYSGKIRSLTTLVHEFVTNSLDSCEDAKILPEIRVEISELPDDHYKLVVEDNGTGISRKNVGQALGKLLAGTKFSQRAQRRGQQGIGACMRSDTLVPLADGRILPIKEIVDANSVGENVISFDTETQKMVPARISECIWVVNPEFIKLSTSRGRTIYLTPENPVLTLQNAKLEWIPVGEVHRGQKIAAPAAFAVSHTRIRMLPLVSQGKLQVDDEPLMAELYKRLTGKYGSLAEVARQTGFRKDVLRNWFTRKMPNGRSRGRPGLADAKKLAEFGGIKDMTFRRVGRNGTFANIPEFLNEEVCWLAGLVAGDGHLTRPEDDKWGVGISFHNKDRRLIEKFGQVLEKQFGVKYSILYNAEKDYYTAQTSSRIVADILVSLGVKRGHKSSTFDVSNRLLEADDRLVASYLRGLFDAEGSITARNRAISFMVYNPNVMEKLAYLLPRFGIQSGLQRNGVQKRLMIAGKENLTRFVERIGFTAPEKNQLILALASSIKKTYEPSQSLRGLVEPAKACLEESNVVVDALPSAAKTAIRKGYLSKHALKQILAVTNGSLHSVLQQYAESDVEWLTVTSVEKTRNVEEYVYDLEVEKHHNFVANGLIVHNSYATLFAQITTGKPTKVKTGLGDGKVYECQVSIDVKSNEPAITDEKEYAGKFKGLRIEAEYAEVGFNRSEYGSYEYLRRTALANPHCQITLVEPDNQITVFPRASKEVPKKPKNVQPHPLGITTSDLMDMAAVTSARKISSFLVSDFTRVSAEKVKELQALMPAVDLERSPKALQWSEAEELVKNFQKVKWIAPETDALIPIGEDQLEKSLKNLLEPEKLKVVERRARVFRGGIPFSVEVAIAYGGKAGQQVGEAKKGELVRFANRVPLLFDAGNCAITEAFKSLDLNRYELKEFETMPVTMLVNFVSVYVPYTGAGKLAISAEEEIVAEIRFALMEAARDISTYLHGLAKAEEQERRRQIFFKYIKEIAQALEDVTGRKASALEPKLRKIAEERTALLEAQEEGDPEAEAALEEIEEQFEEEVKNEG